MVNYKVLIVGKEDDYTHQLLNEFRKLFNIKYCKDCKSIDSKDIILLNCFDNNQLNLKILDQLNDKRNSVILLYDNNMELDYLEQYNNIYGVHSRKLDLYLLKNSIKIAYNSLIKETELKNQNQIINKYINTIQDIILILNINGEIEFVNKGFEKIVGYSLKEVKGQDWFKLCIKDSGDYEKVKNAFNNIINNNLEPVEYFENKIKIKNGKLLNIRWHNSYLYDEEEKIMKVISSGRDITELKEKNYELTKYRTKIGSLFSLMKETVVFHEIEYDDDGEAVDYIITDCNNAFLKLIDEEYKENIIGLYASDLYEINEPPYLEIYSEVVRNANAIEFIDYYEPLDKYFLISVVSLSKNEFATITTDITSIKNVEKKLEQKNNELENYLYVASHDLRSPLVNIQGFTKRIEKSVSELNFIFNDYNYKKNDSDILIELFENKIPKSFKFINSSVTKMENLINSLLQISRTGRLNVQFAKLNIKRIIENIIESNKYVLNKINAKVEIGDLPFCYGDEKLINQLLTNIIVNSVKYRKQKETLNIKIYGETKKKKNIYYVRDNGIGIKKKNLNKIWNVFFQENPANNNKGEGIGLSIVKTIIDKHNGEINVISKEGEGTTFIIKLLKYISSQENIYEEL